MTQNWDYAELSKAAKAAGGPEKYVELLEKAKFSDDDFLYILGDVIDRNGGWWRCYFEGNA